MSSNTINRDPIGVFDSGIGGLTILKEMEIRLPNENFIYYADQKNCPYGPRTQKEIIEICEQITDTLLLMGVKTIVIACNTATMAAVKHLRARYEIPFVATEPAIKPASENSVSGVIGVIATKSSIESSQLQELCNRYSSGKVIVAQSAVGLVDLIENGNEQSEETLELLHKYIDPMINKGIDHLVLGCTHYPFLTKQIETVIGNKNITIVNPAASIAKRLEVVLKEKKLLNNSGKKGEITFLSSLETSQSDVLSKRFKEYSNRK